MWDIIRSSFEDLTVNLWISQIAGLIGLIVIGIVIFVVIQNKNKKNSKKKKKASSKSSNKNDKKVLNSGFSFLDDNYLKNYIESIEMSN